MDQEYIEIKNLLKKAVDELDIETNNINLERPAGEGFGDWSTNVAMIEGRKTKKDPRQLAEEIMEKVKKPEFVEKIEVAGGGFINFYINRETQVRAAEKLNYEVELKKVLSEHGKSKTVVVDYSAPNIAKPFGIGHLRSTNIGQAIYNIYKILGWRCIGDNHLGDWGTQFGKMITAIDRWGKKAVENMSIEELEKLYVKFHQEAESDEKLEGEARQWFSKLEKGDKKAREIWQKIVDTSIKEFDRVYKILGVKIDFAHGESFYLSMLGDVIEEGKSIAKKSQGALVVELANMPPAMLRKSNGATTYFTRDMATIKYRMKEWNPDLIVYEVGADQGLHFRQVFAAAEKMGWIDNCRLVHVGHGLLRWKDAKFSTRKGDTIHLLEVIEKARQKAIEAAQNRLVGKKMKEEEKKEVVEAVAIGAIKFADLLSDPKKDIIFDWERVMNFEGNSGPYLQYTYARCKSVLKKTEIREQKNLDKMAEKWEKEEESLLKILGRFEEKIVEAADRFCPSVIAEYLLAVARAYNEFYAQHKIIGEKEEVRRIFLTRCTASVLKLGLTLLGIKTVERM